MIGPPGRGHHLFETNAGAQCWGTGSKPSTGKFFIHIDAQDAQDFFLKTGGGRARGQSGACQREFVGFRRSRRPDSPTTAPSGWPHPGARASRPHALPFGAAQFPCDAAPGHPAGGYGMGSAEAESWLRCRSSRVEEMSRGCGKTCAGGTPALPGGPLSMTSSRQWRATGICVHSWFVFNNHRQFLPPMICPAERGRYLPETNEKKSTPRSDTRATKRVESAQEGCANGRQGGQ